MIYYGNKMDVVRFATELQLLSNEAWQSTTITRVDTSGAYSVSIATDMLSADTVEKLAQTYSLRPTVICLPSTPVGKFRRK